MEFNDDDKTIYKWLKLNLKLAHKWQPLTKKSIDELTGWEFKW